MSESSITAAPPIASLAGGGGHDAGPTHCCVCNVSPAPLPCPVCGVVAYCSTECAYSDRAAHSDACDALVLVSAVRAAAEAPATSACALPACGLPCTGPGAHRCGGCLAVAYCSDACGAAHWDEHSLSGCLDASVARLRAGYGEVQSLDVLLLSALQTARAEVGEDAALSRQRERDYARVLVRQGRYAAAEPLLRDALARAERLFGAEHAEAATVAGELGEALVLLEKRDEARPLLDRGLMGLDTLSVRNSLIALLYHEDDDEGAEALAREAFADCERAVGRAHRASLESRDWLASALLAQGVREDAAPHAREALSDALLGGLGLKHPVTLGILGTCSWLFETAERSVEAEALQREQIRLRRVVCTSEHPSTLSSIVWLAELVRRSPGRLQEAEPMLQEVLATRRRLLGNTHADTLCAIDGHASILGELGRWSEAEALRCEEVEVRRSTLADDDHELLTTLADHATALEALGRSVEALPLRREEMETRRRTLARCVDYDDEALGDLMVSVWDYAALLDSLEMYGEVEPLWREVLSFRRRTLGDEHEDTLAALDNLASCLVFDSSRRFDAEPLFCELVSSRRRVLGDDHEDTLDAIYSLATLLMYDPKRWREAETMSRELLAARLRTVGVRDPLTRGANNMFKAIQSIVRRGEGAAAEAAPSPSALPWEHIAYSHQRKE